MSQQNINTTASESKESSHFNGMDDQDGMGELLSDAFYAPVEADVIDSLLGRYRHMRGKIEEIAGAVTSSVNAPAVAHFISGNLSSRRGYHGRTVAEIFSVQGAVASLNAAFWQEALDLTDVYQYMPNDRRNAWNDQIREMEAPDFEEKTVRATLSELLFSREKFFAERVDGIFRNLSGEHVTNRPEGFGKRMIMARVYDEWGGNNYDRTGYIDDLRQVIAKFMGRDATSYRTTDKILKIARSRAGEWLTLDGGALRVKAFLKGTAHLEIHPDMAWRLNDILAFLHPTAIPAEHRQKPRVKAKSFELRANLLPFSVLSELSELEIERTEVLQRNRWEEPRQSVTTNPNNRRFKHLMDFDKAVRAEAEKVLLSIGGVKMARNAFTWFEFDYDPTAVIQDIQLSGALPDQKTHQFYPTSGELATQLLDEVNICEGESCLEPSAGMGGLADLMPKTQTTCVEISPLHCRVLEAKGHSVIEGDFMQWAAETRQRFDVVVMNPPYSEGRAAAHLKAAAGLVKAGGRLGAIMPAGADKLDALPGWDCNWSEPLEGMFSGTGVRVMRLVAYKPE
ncbi:class I SAM-dependent methyltransferase [Duffyella gerundensis]|uniref:class I SAM-dependent methyltransferase n=1 Tax=Duffyella gerundensis TaxID=1619313 RepID=UPI0021CC7166|nr:class I SAM-dependent methyltransferase [Duffyella gerundensis]